MEELWEKFKANTGLQRVLIFALLVFVLYLVRSMIDLILLTFIFTFLITRLEKVILRWVKVPRKLIVIVLYVLIVIFLYFAITHYLPIIIDQVISTFNAVMKFYNNPGNNDFLKYVVNLINDSNVKAYIDSGVKFIIGSLSGIGSIGISFFMALILSLFFALEQERVVHFSSKFLTSKIGPVFREIAYFGKKFVGTFGVVLEAQFLIALVNTFLTTIALIAMGFPQVLTLSIMVFLLGLIPVAGVIISCIPLSIIAYSVGGITDVIVILITIVIVHAIETYILNPKLMSSKTDLPVFYTFIILIFSEHFFGVWGLIVGIPVVVFLFDVLGVRGNEAEIKNRSFWGFKKKPKKNK
ncbi:membrane protein [Listeria weihenstephanensis]|uniref:Membrane protein n=1 Tax=Listeria weihenstephanensis TaxID=1006155 RepID=A0A1S7FTJ1_9LIST|nr:membrane protein [Listeria weihenstephanensis]